MTVYGVHAGLQQTSTDELRALWRRIEDLGFGWISIWDHFYSATASDGAESLEAVAMHAALACDTQRVRCGSLVYSVGYRHPAVLANAVCTIDQLSAGRAELEPGRVRRLRHPVPAHRHPHGPARGGHPVRAGPAP
jgi:alkanesulfonate monooxygenase SsuD/methylene tetrahydromethanopterin reductase-like flavin-dependent oxidoreductase (luciferase family)